MTLADPLGVSCAFTTANFVTKEGCFRLDRELRNANVEEESPQWARRWRFGEQLLCQMVVRGWFTVPGMFYFKTMPTGYFKTMPIGAY